MKYALMLLCLAFLVGGCSSGSNAPPLNADQEKQATDLADIAKKSGGDWNSLSDADKQKLILIGGSEQGAKMLLMGKSGKLGRHGPPGGPPRAPGG